MNQSPSVFAIYAPMFLMIAVAGLLASLFFAGATFLGGKLKVTREKMRADKVDLIMGFSGLDETLGQTIHARRAYTMDDIVWGAQFANVLTMLPDGTREIDYRVFHEIERQELPAGFGP